MSKVTAKRVSNYELFYDLVFVLATSGLTGLLHGEHLTFAAIKIFFGATVGLLALWFYETVYLNKFGERDREDIYTIIAEMFILGQMAINMTVTPTQQTVVIFQSLYALAYGVILLQYILRGRKSGHFSADMRAHMRNLVWITGYFALTAIGAILNILPFGDWVVIGMLVPFIVPFIFRNLDMTEAVNFPHLVERCQLITIITFGESVIAIIRNYPVQTYLLESIAFFVGMAFLFVSYISQTHLNINHHQIAPAAPLIYSHLGLIFGVNLFTVGVEMLPDHHHAEAGILFFLLGIALFYLCLLSTSTYNRKELRLDWREWGAQLILLAVGLGAIYLLHHNLLAVGIAFFILTRGMNYLGFVIRRNGRQRAGKI